MFVNRDRLESRIHPWISPVCFFLNNFRIVPDTTLHVAHLLICRLDTLRRNKKKSSVFFSCYQFGAVTAGDFVAKLREP